MDFGVEAGAALGRDAEAEPDLPPEIAANHRGEPGAAWARRRRGPR